jgi:hypothetical protein
MSQDAEAISGPASTPVGRSAAAERMRASRERRRLGLRCLTVQLREAEVNVARNDPRAVRKALHTYLDRTLGKAL